ncbi:MAG: hypothetical protein V4695_12800 [Pseudomonadota bacterium]
MADCPICTLDACDELPGNASDSLGFNCRRCGEFRLTGTLHDMLEPDGPDKDDPRTAVVSHTVRKMQRNGYVPLLDSDWYKRVCETGKLPRPNEQITNLLLWVGEEAKGTDDTVINESEQLQAIIGSPKPSMVFEIALYLAERGLVKYENMFIDYLSQPLQFQMTLDGWAEFDRLNRDSRDSRIAFMAMKFHDPELNNIVDTVFRPAVAATGFELRVLTDVPRAGSIDDRMRVEIRRSRFMLADLTHGNNGAYWEAGYAEGLGLPVIYTFKKEAFEKQASHFDTNHHLTVMWGNNPADVMEELKATIRATLPAEAKLDDD